MKRKGFLQLQLLSKSVNYQFTAHSTMINRDLTTIPLEHDLPERVVPDRVLIRYFRLALRSNPEKAREMWDRVYDEREIRPLCYAVLNANGKTYLDKLVRKNKDKAEKLLILFSEKPYYWNNWRKELSNKG